MIFIRMFPYRVYNVTHSLFKAYEWKKEKEKKEKKLSENMVNGCHTSKPYDMIKSSMVRDKLA